MHINYKFYFSLFQLNKEIKPEQFFCCGFTNMKTWRRPSHNEKVYKTKSTEILLKFFFFENKKLNN